jgi:hypothetical protein
VVRLTVPGASVNDLDLYLIRVEVDTANPTQTVTSRAFFVAAPAAPSVGRDPEWPAYLPQNASAMRYAMQLTGRLRVTWCYRRNLSLLKSFLSKNAIADPNVVRYVRQPLTSTWPNFQSEVPAEKAATRLAQNGFALEAQFAAHSTGNVEFERSIAEQALKGVEERVREMAANPVPAQAGELKFVRSEAAGLKRAAR